MVSFDKAKDQGDPIRLPVLCESLPDFQVGRISRDVKSAKSYKAQRAGG